MGEPTVPFPQSCSPRSIHPMDKLVEVVPPPCNSVVVVSKKSKVVSYDRYNRKKRSQPRPFLSMLTSKPPMMLRLLKPPPEHPLVPCSRLSLPPLESLLCYKFNTTKRKIVFVCLMKNYPSSNTHDLEE